MRPLDIMDSAAPRVVSESAIAREPLNSLVLRRGRVLDAPRRMFRQAEVWIREMVRLPGTFYN